jgi:hypothetical protein
LISDFRFQIADCGFVRPSVISHQLSAISYQPSVISHQLSAISYQPSAICHELSAEGPAEGVDAFRETFTVFVQCLLFLIRDIASIQCKG